MLLGYGLLGRLWTVCSSGVLWRIRLDFGLLEAGGRGLRTVCSSRVCGESIRSLGGWGDFEGLVGVGFASETCWSLGRWCCCENLVEEWFCWKSYWNLGWWIDGVDLANFAWCCEQGDVEVGICTLYDLPITTTVLVFLFRCFCQLFEATFKPLPSNVSSTSFSGFLLKWYTCLLLNREPSIWRNMFLYHN